MATANFYKKHCDLENPLKQAVSDGAIKLLTHECTTYCGQSYHQCINAETEQNIENTFVCYNQEAIHRYYATCFCAE